MSDRLQTVVICWLCFLFVLPVQAQPQVIVVIADHLTLGDVTSSSLRGLTHMREAGQIGLMSPGLAQGDKPISNVYASLGAGDAIHVGNISQGLLGRTLAMNHLRTTLIGNADSDVAGASRPGLAMLPMLDSLSLKDGTTAAPTVPGGRCINPARLFSLTQSALRTNSLVVVHDGDFARTERERSDLTLFAYKCHRAQALILLDRYLSRCQAEADAHRELSMWFIVPTGTLGSDGKWDSLTPFLCYGHNITPHSVPYSHTTQTPGLIAARDIAPSLLTTLGVTPPYTMTGVAIETSQGSQLSDQRLAHLDRMTRLNQRAQNPFFWTLGFAGAAALLLSIGLTVTGRLAHHPRSRRMSLYGLRVLCAVPLAMMLAPGLNPLSLNSYLAQITGVTILLGLLPTPTVILSLTALVLVGDGLTGTHLVSQSLLSAYALSGIRFYGIGNEYMGVLIAGTLLLSALPGLTKACGTQLLFALVTFVLSFPSFGAKAGGAVTAASVFFIAWRRLRGKTVSKRHIVFGITLGFLLIFVWAAIGHWLPLRHTHIDTAAEALSGGRFGYIAGVALRKIGLAVRVTLNSGTLMGVLAIALVTGAAWLALRRSLGAYLRANPRFAAVWTAGLWGCLISLLFNDSGIVAAILLILCLGLTLLHGVISSEAIV